jgi:hypothetical protein
MYENEIKSLEFIRDDLGAIKAIDTTIRLMRAAEPEDEAAEEHACLELLPRTVSFSGVEALNAIKLGRAAVRAECQAELGQLFGLECCTDHACVMSHVCKTAETIHKLRVQTAKDRAEIERLKAQVNTMITTVARKGPPRTCPAFSGAGRCTCADGYRARSRR